MTEAEGHDDRDHEEGVSAGTDTDDAAETTNAGETLGDIAADSPEQDAGGPAAAG
jgi:hypothetical protein